MAGAGNTLLSQVLSMAVKRGLVKAKQHVVCVLSVRGDLVLNVCQVDDKGSGLQSNLASLGESHLHVLQNCMCTGIHGAPLIEVVQAHKQARRLYVTRRQIGLGWHRLSHCQLSKALL